METQFLEKGLSTEKAKRYLAQFGRNEITANEGRSVLTIFLLQFNNFLILLLIAAAAVSYYVGDPLDALFIVIIVVLNVVFGFYQEYKAEASLAALKKMTITNTRVVRDGEEIELDSHLLVPGDVIYLEEGTKIPADAILIGSWNCEVDESALTGESLPQSKKTDGSAKESEIYSGTTVVRGRAYAVITKTGDNTKFGVIAQKLSRIDREPTPLQKKLQTLTRFIGLLGLIASVLVFVLSLLHNRTLFESFLFSVSLAVAAVPEGLPAVMTITLANGVKRMAQKNAIVRRLQSIEALGTVTLLATDKTGTITSNKMVVKKIVDQGKSALHILYLNAIICSTASLVSRADHGKSYDIIGDPTEGAVLRAAMEAGIDYEKVRENSEKLNEVAFDSQTKRMSVVAKHKGVSYVFSKGAPEVILKDCMKTYKENMVVPLTKEEREHIEKEIQKSAEMGYRLIAFSYKKGQRLSNNEHIFLGFAQLSDPLRPEIRDAVANAQKAGIKVIMITGDNKLTAQTIGIEAGILQKGEDVVEGHQLDEYTDQELLEILPHTKIFARTSPLHKHRLVKLYQKLGEIVAVTGDGVNDALALKQANVGVAMGKKGTDVARETADMIIVDDNFATLVNAVEEGRIIFINIKKAIRYLLSTNIAEIIIVISTLLITSSVALTALQILYINLVSDGLPALSLAFLPKSTAAMNKNQNNGRLIEKEDMHFIGFVSIFCSFLTLLSYFIGNQVAGSYGARTMAFSTLIFIQPFVLFYLWSRHSLRKGLALLKTPLFASAFSLSFVLHPIIFYTPFLNDVLFGSTLPFQFIILCVVISSLILIPFEIKRTQKTAHVV